MYIPLFRPWRPARILLLGAEDEDDDDDEGAERGAARGAVRGAVEAALGRERELTLVWLGFSARVG